MGSPFVWWKTGKLSFLPVNRTDRVHDEVQNRLFPQIFRYDLQCLMELAPVMYPAPCDLQISKIWCSSTSTFQAQSGNILIWHLEAVFILFADLFFLFGCSYWTARSVPSSAASYHCGSVSVLSVPPSDPEDRETEENISAESPFPFLIHITGTSGTVAVLSLRKLIQVHLPNPFQWIIIVGFCNVILFTPGRYIHTFQTVLTFSDLFCPVHKADLLCNQTGLFCHSEYLHKW